jgi:hypothetical protein
MEGLYYKITHYELFRRVSEMKARSLLVAIMALLISGCATLKPQNEASPGRIVAISQFQCDCDPVLLEQIRYAFVEVFVAQSNALPVVGDVGDIVITGAITLSEGTTGSSGGGLFGHTNRGVGSIHGVSRGSTATGVYISGITVKASKDGELLTALSIGEDLGGGRGPFRRGGSLRAPINTAKNAAVQIYQKLFQLNEIGRKER